MLRVIGYAYFYMRFPTYLHTCAYLYVYYAHAICMHFSVFFDGRNYGVFQQGTPHVVHIPITCVFTIMQHFSDCDGSAIYRISPNNLSIWTKSFQNPMQFDLFQTSSKFWFTWVVQDFVHQPYGWDSISISLVVGVRLRFLNTQNTCFDNVWWLLMMFKDCWWIFIIWLTIFDDLVLSAISY
jgi:hypothetical protein